MRKINVLLSVALLLLVFGCSNKVPLGGKVTFSDDGSAVPKGVVCFVSSNLMAQGKINPDGSYTMGTDKSTDGLPKGSYKVSIVGTDNSTVVEEKVKGSSSMSRREIRTPTIDKKYSNPETSGLTFTVDGKNRNFDIQVDRARK